MASTIQMTLECTPAQAAQITHFLAQSHLAEQVVPVRRAATRAQQTVQGFTQAPQLTPVNPLNIGEESTIG